VATADPGTLVLAVDADARSMVDESRRAAARPEWGGLANLIFLAEGAERLPVAFDGLADHVTLLFPWGSLLRGAMGLEPAVSASIARLLAPGGRLEMVVSIVARDRPAVGRGEGPFGSTDVETLTETFSNLGVDAVALSRLSLDEVRATGSTWARRLRADPDRPVWRVDLGRRRRSD
jgi:16S rRNA (adenine(1408)-N(1))-methyltransferase